MCKGSTADSDSVCEGSNPSPAAKRLSAYAGSFFFCHGSLIGIRTLTQIQSGRSSRRLRRGFESFSRCQKDSQQKLRVFSFCHGSLIGIPGPPRAAAPIRKICGPVRRPGPPERRTGPAPPGQRRPGGPLRRLLPVCPPGGTARRGLPADHRPRQQSAYDRHPPGRTVRRQPGHHGPGGQISGPAVLIP